MLYLGMDWSDAKLDFELHDNEDNVLASGHVTADAAGLAELFQKVGAAHAQPDDVAVGIESTRAAWIQALLDRGYKVYPLNSKAVYDFRKSLHISGVKTDAIDAGVIAMYLRLAHKKLRAIAPESPEIVALRIACQDRLRLVQERTAKLNELLSLIKTYYPAFVDFFGLLDSDISLAFLQDFPTQAQFQAVKPKTLQRWLKAHHYPCMQRLEEMTEHLAKPALRVQSHLQQAKAPLIRYLAIALASLNAVIGEREKDIQQQFEQLPEAQWAKSLPGAGPTLGPALLAIFGRDPDRFRGHGEARGFFGTAPVTEQSGKTSVTYFRRGCWKFARHTLQMFAHASIRGCDWAMEFYRHQLDHGHDHHEALRALAHKWVKIILAMARANREYDESIFLRSRKRYASNATTAA